MPLFRYSAAVRRRVFSELRCFSDRAAQVNEAGPLACRLKSRSVIGFRGPDCIKFLQGLLTNDVRPLAHGSSGETAGEGSQTSYAPTPNVAFHRPPPIYAAMLTPQGRFLYDLFLYCPPKPEQKLDRTGSGPASGGSEDGPAVLADVDSTVLDEILDSFKKYRLRANIEIENLSGDFTCWQRFSGNRAKDTSTVQEPEAASVGWGGGVDLTADSSSQGNNIGCQWYKDPRLECLGFRGIFPSDTVPPLVEADKEADESHYLLWRLEKGVAEGSSEIPKGEAIPLEYNLAGLNAISFDKGCYVGQELVARTHHRGVIRKRLLPFKFVDSNGKEVQQKVSPHSDIIDSNSDKKVGHVTTAIGCRGMGLVKLDEAFKDSADLRIKDGGDVRVQVFKPDWWPAEWTQAHEQRTVAA